MTGTTTTELHALSVAEAGALLRARQVSSVDLTRNALDRIARHDGDVRAFVTVTDEHALERAQQADRELAAGVDRGPLHGIPYALKDVFDTEGIRTTNHSWLTVDHVPARDCGVQERLLAGGGVMVGKLATHEFALGGPSPELPFPPARNPWNLDHFTGASSSGAGAAVAAGFVRVAIGSDTSGSVRGPAYHCGTVGLKPTYGLVSRRGVFPLSYSMDHCGPLAWTVQDAALAMRVIAGHDPGDPSSVDRAVPPFDAELGSGVRGLRVAYSPGMFAADAVTSPEVLAGIERAVAVLRSSGAVVEEVELPPFELFNACGRVIMTAEAFAIHERDLRERPQLFGRYTYHRVAPGAGLTAADFVQALRLRRELAEQVQQVLDGHDVLLTAAGLTTAAKFTDFGRDWPPPKTATAMQTIPFNVTGHPALVLPTGLAGNGLPTGLQLVGHAFGEAMILRVAATLERALGHPTVRPPGFGIGDPLR
ncbi:amidase [Saccharothrix sp. NRRL B-16314]|uniref:amidase n=1 Tax=Saccharothrix sp. NRRL B-16314 TaxID=1463825 RepID=UPI000523FE5C|nr:amidase [Saccharothrix sp. NRRL B-16314]